MESVDSASQNIILENRYQVQNKVGQGAMGTVYQVWDFELQRRLALKILHPEQAQDENSKKRFIREAQSIGKLNHRNIVTIHSVSEYQGRPFFIMEFLEGKNLQEIIAEKEISPRLAMKWIYEIAMAVEYAHQNHIIHRDIKPSNILITSQGPVLTDFGIAKDFTGQTQLTIEGESLGTPAYMSPEQAQGEWNNINPSSDVYSLGAVLYELLTRHSPFDGPPLKVLQQVCTVEPAPIRKYNREVHGAAVVIVNKAMCKQQQYRYHSAAEMAEDILHYLNGEAIKGKLPPIYLKFFWLVQQNKAVMATTIAAAGVILAAIGWAFYNEYQQIQAKKAKLHQLISQAEEKRTHLDEQSSLKKMFQVFDLYSEMLALSPSLTPAREGKFDICLRLGDRAVRAGNFEFAHAMYFLAEQIAEELESQAKKNEVAAKKAGITEKESQLVEQQLRQAGEIIRLLYTPHLTRTEIKDIAFFLLRFKNIWSQIQLKYQAVRYKNPQIRQALELVEKCFVHQGEGKILGLSSLENSLIDLLVYNPAIIHEVLLEYEFIGETQKILAARLAGLTKCDEARQLLIDLASQSDSDRLSKYSLQSLLLLEQGEQTILQALEQGRLSLEHLKNIEIWGIRVVFEWVRRHPLEQQQLLSQIFRSIGPGSIPLIALELSEVGQAQKLTLLPLLALWQQQSSHELLLQYAESAIAEPVRIRALEALANFPGEKTRANLKRALKDSNSQVVLAAAKSLAALNTWEITRDLLQVMQEQPRLREPLVEIISQMRDNKVAKVIVEQIQSSSSLRLLGMKVLGKLQSPIAIRPLSHFLAHGSPQEQLHARKALAQIGRQASVFLHQQLYPKLAPSQKEHVLYVIGETQDFSGTQLLLAALGDSLLQEQAIASLAKLGKKVIPLLLENLQNATEPTLQQGAAQALGKIGSPALPDLLTAFKKSPSQQREKLQRAFVAMGKVCVYELTELLREESELDIRERSIAILGELDTLEVIPALLEALEDPEYKIRRQAQQALEKIGSPAVPILMSRLSDFSEDTRTLILRVLGEIGDIRSKKVFLRLLDDPSKIETAALALRNIAEKDPSLPGELIKRLRQKEYREGAKRTLSYLVRSRELGRSLNKKLKTALTSELLEKNDQARAAVIEILAQPRNIDFLIHAYSQERNRTLRAAYKRAILELEERALRPLFKAWFSNHSAYHDLVESVVEANSRKAIPWLIRSLRKKDSFADKAKDLFPLMGSTAHTPLIRLLRDPDPFIRKVAVELVGEMHVRRALAVLRRLERDPQDEVRREVGRAIDKIEKAHGLK